MNKLKLLLEWYKEFMYWSRMPEPDYITGRWIERGWLEAHIDFIKFVLSILLCKYKGHKWKDNGYAGPESGAIDMECTRCGESHHVQLY